MTDTPEQLEEILDELLTRFIINNGKIESEAALQAAIVQAGYWYLDVLRDQFGVHFNHKVVRQKLLERLNIEGSIEEMVKRIRHFIVGACVFNQSNDKILVIREYNGTIGLPKGKLNVGESLEEGAIREIFEETNVDVTPYLNSDDKITYDMDRTSGRCCFIVRGVPETQHLKCYRRGEVQEITWMSAELVMDCMKSGQMCPWFEIRTRTQHNAKFWKDLLAHIKKQ